MPRIALKVLLMFFACAIGASASVSYAADDAATPAPRAVMEKVIKDILGILRDPALSADQKRSKVQQIAFDNLNFEVMGRLSLGKYFRKLTDFQRTQYQLEFKQLVTNTYGHTTDDYTDEDVKVTGEQQESDGDVTVTTHIMGTKEGKKGQEVAAVNYRLRKVESQWKVIDFTIDGVSLVSNYRSQFQDTMSNGGIEQLIKLLHDKNVANGK